MKNTEFTTFEELSNLREQASIRDLTKAEIRRLRVLKRKHYKEVGVKR